MERKVREDKRYDGCPVCQAWCDGDDPAMLVKPLWVDRVRESPEPHMLICELLGIEHNHPDIW